MSLDEQTHIVDRTGWNPQPGLPYPWDGEPDKEQWTTTVGLPGLIVRQKSHGAWCGYAAVEPGHPLYRVDYDDERVPGQLNQAVHEELTYSGLCHGPVCHIPEPGRPDDVWWFGFDCAHGFDYAPGNAALMRSIDSDTIIGRDYFDQQTQFREVYCDVAYVKLKVESLALALSEIEPT